MASLFIGGIVYKLGFSFTTATHVVGAASFIQEMVATAGTVYWLYQGTKVMIKNTAEWISYVKQQTSKWLNGEEADFNAIILNECIERMSELKESKTLKLFGVEMNFDEILEVIKYVRREHEYHSETIEDDFILIESSDEVPEKYIEIIEYFKRGSKA